MTTPTPDPMKTPEQWLNEIACTGPASSEAIAAIQADARAEAESERDKALSTLARIQPAINRLEQRREEHRKSKACEFPRTCGACHFFSGSITVLQEIMEGKI